MKPEIGKLYEIVDGGYSMGKYTVVGFDGDKVIVTPGNDKYIPITVDHRIVFKEAKDSKTMIIESMARVMYNCDAAGNVSAIEAAKALYSVIESGNIEGLQLDNTGDVLDRVKGRVLNRFIINPETAKGRGYNQAMREVVALISKLKREYNNSDKDS